MSADIIQVRYDELDTVAARFGQQAEQTAALDGQVRRGLQALEHGGWEGKGASAFVAEMYGTLLPANARLHQALDEARAVTLEVKTHFQQAEQEAAALFGHNTAAGVGGVVGSIIAGALAGGVVGTGEAGGAKTLDSVLKIVTSADELILDQFLKEPFKDMITDLSKTLIDGLKNGSVRDWLKDSGVSGLAGDVGGWGVGTLFTFVTDEPSGRGWIHDLVKAGITTAITDIPSPWVKIPVVVSDVVQLGGHMAGAMGYTDVEHTVEKLDLRKGLDWAVEQEMERWEDGGVRGLIMRAVTPPSEMITNDAVQIIGGKLLHIHGIENLDLEHLL